MLLLSPILQCINHPQMQFSPSHKYKRGRMDCCSPSLLERTAVHGKIRQGYDYQSIWFGSVVLFSISTITSVLFDLSTRY